MLRFPIIVALLFLLPAFPVLPQNKPLRIEIPSDIDNNAFHVVPCLNNGLMIFYETVTQVENKEKIWSFRYYDNDLLPLKSYDIPIIKDSYFCQSVTDSVSVFFIFHNPGNARNDPYNFLILKLNPETSAFGVIKATVSGKMRFKTAVAARGRVFAGFESEKHQVQLFFADFITSETTSIDLQGQEKSILENIYYDPLAGNFRVMLNNFISRKDNQILVYTYSLSGMKETEYLIKPEQDYGFNSVTMIALSKTDQLITGTYNNREAGPSELKNEEEAVSTGVYVTKVSNGDVIFLKYYNFIDFKNFYNYMNPAEVFRLKKKAEKESGSNELSLNYRLLVHDVIRNADQFILLSEAYYPDYRTVSYVTYDYYGRPFPQTYTVFEGYDFFSGLITAFNSEGELLYDNGIKIVDISGFELEENLVPFTDNQELVLVYTTSGKIASAIFNLYGEVSGGFEYNDIDLQYPKDKLMQTRRNGIVKWYDDYFLCYGYQEIGNNAMADNNKRTVFFVTKIVFE